MRPVTFFVSIMLLLASAGVSAAQSSAAWLSDCEENANGVICHGWSIQGGDTVAEVFGCQGATGGGVLSCRGRTLCELKERVTIRGFSGDCTNEDAAGTDQADTDGTPDPETATLDAQQLEQLAEVAVDRMMAAQTHGERLEIAREFDRLFKKQIELNGLRNTGGWVNRTHVDSLDFSEIFGEVADGDCTGARSRLKDNFQSWNRNAGVERNIIASNVYELICGSTRNNGFERHPVKRRLAGSACIIHDPNDTSANVRVSPNGQVINKLRNGRAVIVTSIKKDNQGRNWMFVEGDYNGSWRKWGYVFGELLSCEG